MPHRHRTTIDEYVPAEEYIDDVGRHVQMPPVKRRPDGEPAEATARAGADARAVTTPAAR